jgi:BirA family biotin operon repressor/biotin-[acetyl-CoA-carboxylase] ligase
MIDLFSLKDPDLLIFDAIDSTNEEAKRMIDSGFAADGAIIWALSQESGKGRSGKEWVSPAGNLYLSFILQPNYSLQKASEISFLTAIALGNSLLKSLPEKAKIEYKWPNDVLLNGKKLAGILLESRFVNLGVKWLIVGLGVNLALHPKNAAILATNLEEAGCKKLAVDKALFSFLKEFSKIHDVWQNKGFSEIRKLWLTQAYGIGQELVTQLNGQNIKGIFKDIGEDGSLILDVRGKTKFINSGEVFFAELAPHKDDHMIKLFQ